MHLPSTPKRVLFFVPFGAWIVHNQLDAVVSSALRLRGAEVLIVLCDGLMPHCYTLVRSKNREEECRACAQTGVAFFSALQLPFVQLRDFVEQGALERCRAMTAGLSSEELRSFRFDGMELGDQLTPSVCSYFRITPERLGKPHVVERHREFLAYSLLAVEGLSRIFDEFAPTHLFLYCGFGFMHSAARLLAEKRSIPFVCHERGYFDGSFMLVQNEPCTSVRAWHEVIEAWRDIPLTRAEAERVRQYFVNREFGKDVNFHAFFSFQTDHAVVRKQLRIPEEARVFTVFTSTEYELLYTWKDFEMVSRQMDVVDSLIEIFRDRKEYLVIRHHPNITGGPAGAPPDTRFIDRSVKQALRAPPNVRVIMPDEKLSTYALLWHTDAALAFLSTVRLEAVARGVPTAASNHPLLAEGVTTKLEDESPQGLSELVDRLLAYSSEFSVEDLRRLYRVTHAYIFRHSTKFRSFEIRNGSDAQLNFATVGDLLPGKDPTLDRVCRHVLDGTPVYDLPKRSDVERRTEEEDRFLVEEFVRVQRYRAEVRAQSAKTAREGEEEVLVIACTGDDSLSPSLFRQRYGNVRLEWTAWENIRELLEMSRAPYVLFAQPNWEYDESLLSSTVAILASAPGVVAVRFGAWVRNATFEIDDVLFAKSRVSISLAEALSIAPALRSPRRIAGLGLFRREALLLQPELLSEVSTVYALYMGRGALHYDIPLAVMLSEERNREDLIANASVR